MGIKTKAQELLDLGEARDEKREAIKKIRRILNGTTVCSVMNLLMEERPHSLVEEVSQYNGDGQAALAGLNTFLSNYPFQAFPWNYVREAMKIGAQQGPEAAQRYAREVPKPAYLGGK